LTLRLTHTPAPPEPELASDPNSDSAQAPEPQLLEDPGPLRPLTALKWPYVPDTSAYPDPLTRDDPKPLQLHQYEAIGTCPAARARLLLTLTLKPTPTLPLIRTRYHVTPRTATSPTIRTLLATPRLRTLLTSIDAFRGPEREEALQRALGVDSRLLKNHDAGTRTTEALDEDTRGFRALAEAVEEAVRGRKEDALGLDWD
jgi:hypothetical protein